jgi:hypothetical protein
MSCAANALEKTNPIRVTDILCPGTLGKACFTWIGCRRNNNITLDINLSRINANGELSRIDITNLISYTAPTGTNEGVITAYPFGPLVQAGGSLSGTPQYLILADPDPNPVDNTTYDRIHWNTSGHSNVTVNTFNLCFPNLTAGRYRLTLRDIEAESCVEVYEFEIKDKSAINAWLDINVSEQCDGKTINVTINAEGSGGVFDYALRGVDINGGNFPFNQVPNLFVDANQNTIITNGVFFNGVTPTSQNIMQWKGTNQFTIGNEPDQLPFDSWDGPDGSKFGYEVWIRPKKSVCPDSQNNYVKVGIINTAEFVQPTYTVTMVPSTFSCGVSNCDGYVNVQLEGASNAFAPYSVHIKPESNSPGATNEIFNNSQNVISKSSSCDASCGFFVQIPICALESTVATNASFPYRYVVNVYDKFGCPVNRNPNNTDHSPANINTQNSHTYFPNFWTRDANNNGNIEQQVHASWFNPRHKNQIDYIRLVPSLTNCPDCCDGEILEMHYFDKYKNLIVAEQFRYLPTPGYRYSTTPDVWSDGFLPESNIANQIELCGIDDVTTAINNAPNFLIRVIEHPSGYKGPNSIVLNRIRTTNTTSLFQQLRNNGLFMNLCPGKYCYELSVSSRGASISGLGSNNNQQHTIRECSCVVQFCVEIACPTPVNII